MTGSTQEWQASACILCSLNCGIEVQTEGRRLAKIRGDREHPASGGYVCQKASRLDFYQNVASRLERPLRRTADGSFEEVSWDTAISEIAERLVSIRDEHGGCALAYYGGGGQGNHLGGVYGGALRAAMGTRYLYNSLAQEKTGGFWVDGRLFGRQTCHTSEDAHNARFLLVIGSNPWQAHGIQQARKLINAIAGDPDRRLVVVDPRLSETAAKADVHLRVRPGGDAHLLLAMLGILVRDDLVARDFIEQRTRGYEELEELLGSIPVEEYAELAGVDLELLSQVTSEYARTDEACIRIDLGLDHSLHSTLNSYLAKLLFLLTGHFGKQGCNNFHSFFLPLIGHSKEPEEGGWTTQITGMREISKFFPPNILPAEIDCDDPRRLRGLVVDSSNPMLSAADTGAYSRALDKLELLVVIDVALTETARKAHYVLPAQSQFEKWEATFFNLEFPENFFHLRKPLFEPAGETLAEPEIYHRLVVAMGELPERFPILERVARLDRKMPKLRLFPLALAATMSLRPSLRPYLSLVLHETLGAALPEGAKSAAVLWGACRFYVERHGEAVRRAGIEDRGAGLAEALFEQILESRSGTVLSHHLYEDNWRFLRHEDRRIHLAIPEMIEEIRELEPVTADPDYPLTLLAGGRASYNANAVIRDPAWRKKGRGELEIHPDDAERIGLADGDKARCETSRGAVEVEVRLSEALRPGMVFLPHGYGIEEPAAPGESARKTGPAINLLTDLDHCDALAKTPFHKQVPARVVALEAGAGGSA